jgi:hypothetical protein
VGCVHGNAGAAGGGATRWTGAAQRKRPETATRAQELFKTYIRTLWKCCVCGLGIRVGIGRARSVVVCGRRTPWGQRVFSQ